jgi:hypothetical protein
MYSINPHTHGLFEDCYLMACVGWMAHKPNTCKYRKMHGLKVNGLSLTGSALTVTILYSTYEVCTETCSRRV